MFFNLAQSQCASPMSFITPSMRQKPWFLVANAQQNSSPDVLNINASSLIWAIDGGVEWCVEHDLTPHVISGDFDSLQDHGIINQHTSTLSQKHLPYRNAAGTLIIPTPDQDKTDTHKALEWAVAHFGIHNITLVQCVGTRMDHVLHHFELLKLFAHSPAQIVLRTQDFLTYYLQQNVRIQGDVGSKIALFGAPKATVTAQSLCYPLKEISLSFGESSSVSNQLAASNAHIEIHGAVFLMHAACCTLEVL